MSFAEMFFLSLEEESMEFFEFADVVTSQEEIRAKVSVETLPDYCEEVEAVDAVEELGRVIYFRQWGRFHIRQETVMGGVLFSVPDCPNALAWTVTTGYPPCLEKIVLHATINRTEHSPEFIGATKALLAAFKTGLEGSFSGESAKAAPQVLPHSLPVRPTATGINGRDIYKYIRVYLVMSRPVWPAPR
ncbi:MAG: hypothetical protein PF568_07625 [Deltaproteobacteria bacterium]|jgi:hypothetical protein|nr:hypothetical protein [Deltaproteobacteria bacterium]